MWELDHKESWAQKNWCFQTVVLEKTLESPLDCKEIKPVSPKGNQPWMFIGRTDAEAEAPIVWLPDVKSWLNGKNFDAGKDWGQEEKGMTEDELVGWHHWLNGHEFEQPPGYRKPGVLQSLGSQRIGHNLATEQQQQNVTLLYSTRENKRRYNLFVGWGHRFGHDWATELNWTKP